MSDLDSIRERLRAAGTDEGRKAAQKFVPTADRTYGVRVPILNELARELDHADLEMVLDLWNSGMYEERLLAAKLLERFGRKEPDQTWRTVQRLAMDIADWATGDTLATEAVRPILKALGPEVAEAASRYVESDGEWTRRFGLVLLTHFVKDPGQQARIEAALASASVDRRTYVKKAAEWLRRDVAKSNSIAADTAG
ncbi:DNA alkylation repair protein [Fimbriimonas ginsengisoli]|uniref:Putative DNA alkylation repair enzyme family n=1 Tax=Fimbriimonas ginsengisoli Gsoil 348 TaxID=661478 RepID=A0A068NJJ4_FIMGI|nr:DNA alkylation repair protein [Fimbriimonas ginsengisoli]AIE83671.1 putative DNA alkylation repair enzyme family [Fimbriimonas ginsengisoli Gsoil 348]